MNRARSDALACGCAVADFHVHHGDCLEVLRGMADNSVDSIVTDPPYGLSFMGKKWDYDVPSEAIWRECLRVLKPGGHLLAFAGTRTQHRMAVRIEDAGFEIRDMIAWLYGSGFPKSLDVSKAIDKVRDWSKVERLNDEIKRARAEAGLSLKEIGEVMQAATGDQYGAWYHRGGHMFFETGRNLPSRPEWEHLRRVLPIAHEFQDAYDEAEREVVNKQRGTMLAVAPGQGNDRGATTLDITAPATDAARQWQGWGSALKPALEPVTVARKPLIGTIAENVLAHGTGALNIDGCRVGSSKSVPASPRGGQDRIYGAYGAQTGDESGHNPNIGRWPANVIHDGSEEVLAGFPESASGSGGRRETSTTKGFSTVGCGPSEIGAFAPYSDAGKGSAARFYYCAKASKRDRGDGNNHPTVKPTDLMRYLCRLVTPPGGTVLDPFTGSGSTGKAAVLEGFSFIGIEREAEYVEIARARIAAAVPPEPVPAPQLDMFGGAA